MRCNNNSCHPTHWTNAKLMQEARKYANLESYCGSIAGDKAIELLPFPADNGDKLREATRIYRQSWLNPILDEIERRFVKK